MKKIKEDVIRRFKASDKAIAIVDKNGHITSWSHGAERLFGYKREEIVGNKIPIIPPGLMSQVRAVTKDSIIYGSVRYKTRRLRKDGKSVDVILTVAPLRNKNDEVIATYNLYQDYEGIIHSYKTKDGKRTFDEIRMLLMLSLYNSQKTINQIANETNINWKTVDNHLTYLVGRALSKEIFSSDFARIFELTDEGREILIRKFPRLLEQQQVNFQ